MKRHKNLIEKITDPLNLYDALHKTAKGKRSKIDCMRFMDWEFRNMAKLRTLIISGSYKPDAPSTFAIFEPKPRSIVALRFHDRVVQHAIHSIISPIFNKTFLPCSYACRIGYGAHRAARDVQAAIRKTPQGWYLKTDFSKYFHSIDREALWTEIDKKIGCKRTSALIEKFVPRTGKGINIGELLSQLFANVMGNRVDMFIKHELHVKSFFRYMDDIVILGDNRSSLEEMKRRIESFCASIGLRFSKWFIKPISAGINFVGYRIWPTHKLIRKDSIKRAKRKLKRLRGEPLQLFLASWRGHIGHANTYNLQRRLGI